MYGDQLKYGRSALVWVISVCGLGFAHTITLLLGSVLRERISTWAVLAASIFGLLLATVLVFVGTAEYLSRDEHSHFSLFALVPILMIAVFAISVFVLLIGVVARAIQRACPNFCV